MSLLSWVSILGLIIIFYSLSVLIPIILRTRSSFIMLMALSLVAYLGSNLTYLISPDFLTVIRWFNFSSLVLLVSSLFSLIRESKPIFARFPSYLIYLPFITLLFFPLIADQNVITNLLLGTFQVGCVIVGIFMFGISQIKNKDSLLQLVGAFIFLSAISLFWFTPVLPDNKVVITEMLIIAGILITSIGLRKKYLIKNID